MKDWIKICDGYVRTDAIVDVHINKTYPGVVYLALVNGDSVKYRDFGGDKKSAEIVMEELVDFLTGHSIDLHSLY